jgi:hypothetical protein
MLPGSRFYTLSSLIKFALFELSDVFLSHRDTLYPLKLTRREHQLFFTWPVSGKRMLEKLSSPMLVSWQRNLARSPSTWSTDTMARAAQSRKCSHRNLFLHPNFKISWLYYLCKQYFFFRNGNFFHNSKKYIDETSLIKP